MSRQDQVVDDDEPEVCPLCIEELDPTDIRFRPCPCGYQVCQFCYNNIKTSMNGLCPACRRTYDDANVKYDAPSAEDWARHKEIQQSKERKARAAKKQEAASRQADTLSRKHLAGIRVRRQNLVYVTGLRLITSHPQLVERLREDQFFGQYGRIDKIVVNRPKDSQATQPVGVYITYFDNESAADCILAVNNSINNGSTIRADYGTTKYCSAFLRHETCTNKNCTFLHEVGDENESFTREGLSSLNAFSSQAHEESSAQATDPPPQQQEPPQPHHFPAMSEAMERSDSKAQEVADNQTLPTAASWAKPRTNSRRPSPVRTSASASPAPSAVATAAKGKEPESEQATPAAPADATTSESPAPTTRPRKKSLTVLEKIYKSLRRPPFDPNVKYEVNPPGGLSEEERRVINCMPPLFDPNGYAKRQAGKAAMEQRQLKRDQEVATQTLSGMNTHTEDNTAGGSLQLGGEPEDRQDPASNQRQPFDSDSLNFSNLNLTHALSPEAQTSALSGRSSVAHQSGFMPNSIKSPSPGMSNALQNPFSGSQYGGGHARQKSRFSFANDPTGSTSTFKAGSNPKYVNQQSSAPGAMAGQYGQSAGQYLAGGLQAPPGLKATGTPPVSGGGMFGQGHGFATAGLGFGGNYPGRKGSDDMINDMRRNCVGSAGSGQASEASRREFTLSSPPYQSPYPYPTHNPGLSSLPYGSYSGAFQNSGGPQKGKKKGKKHRHANTSSSGGGVVDLVDPNILQSRMHQTGGNSSHGYYGAQGLGQGRGQGQGGFNSMMHGNGGYDGRW